MEFWILTIITLLSGIYCCDLPAIKGFEFLVHQENSIFYTVGCAIIAIYVFYIIHFLLLRKRKDKNMELKRNNDVAKLSLTQIFIIVTMVIMLLCVVSVQGGFEWHDNALGAGKDAKLEFMGAVIGSGLTMLGVVMTILFSIHTQKISELKHETERKEDFSIKYRPILQIDHNEINFLTSEVDEAEYADDEFGGYNEQIGVIRHRENWIQVNIKLKNIGRGEILKAIVCCVAEDEYFKVNYNKTITNIFPQDNFWISLHVNLKDPEAFIYEWFDVTVNIEVKYYDCVNKESQIIIPIEIANHGATEYFDELSENITHNNTIEYKVGNIKRSPIL